MTDSAIREIAGTLQWLELIGAPAFPAQYGKKGTWVKGWTTGTPTKTDYEEWFPSGRRVNIAARTGSHLGVIDLDTKHGADGIIAMLPPGCPVSKSWRGYHIFFRPKKVVGNGPLPNGVKGEVFTASHLIMLPPSRHPKGVDYTWLIPPDGSLPIVDLEELGLVPLGSKNKDSYTQSRQAPVENLERHFATLAKLLGQPRRSGRWLMFRCPWHAEGSEQNESLGVTPDGWCQCFACGERGWIDTILKRLTGPCNGSFIFPPGVEDLQLRVVAAFESLGQEKLASEMRRCGRTFKVYRCEQGHTPAYPMSCKSPFCPRCRGKRLTAHLANKTDVFEMLRQPMGLILTPSPLSVAEPASARQKAEMQTRTVMKALRVLSVGICELKNIVRVMSPSCANGLLQVTHAVVLDEIDERARASLIMAMRQLDVKAELQTLHDGAEAERWLYRQAVRFEFETNEDLLALLLGFKGLSIIRGWGNMRSATGGMLKGAAKPPPGICPVCGSALGKPLGEVDADTVEFVDGQGFMWRGPPT